MQPLKELPADRPKVDDPIAEAARLLVLSRGRVTKRINQLTYLISGSPESAALRVYERARDADFPALVSYFRDKDPQHSDISCYAQMTGIQPNMFANEKFSLSFLRDRQSPVAYAWRCLQCRRFFAASTLGADCSSLLAHARSTLAGDQSLPDVERFLIDSQSSELFELGVPLATLESAKPLLTVDPVLLADSADLRGALRSRTADGLSDSQLDSLQTLLFLLRPTANYPPFRPTRDNYREYQRAALEALLSDAPKEQWRLPKEPLVNEKIAAIVRAQLYLSAGGAGL